MQNILHTYIYPLSNTQQIALTIVVHGWLVRYDIMQRTFGNLRYADSLFSAMRIRQFIKCGQIANFADRFIREDTIRWPNKIWCTHSLNVYSDNDV